MWYYALDGERQGPVDKSTIQDLIDEGDLGMNSLVWTSGMDDWTPISEVNDFQPSPPPLPQEESSPTSRESLSSSTSNQTSSNQSSQTTKRSTPGRRSEEKSTGSTENTDPYAGFGRRLVAYAVDMLILLAFFMILGAFIFASSGTSQPPPEGVLNFFGFIVSWLYFALNESTDKQATWGKRLMNLKVTDMEGNQIGFGKATGRHFGKLLSGAILLIGYFMAAFTEKKQALHDKMAGCLVIEGSEKDIGSLSGMERKSHEERRGGDEKISGGGEFYCERAEKTVDPMAGGYTCPACRRGIRDGRHSPVEEVS